MKFRVTLTYEYDVDMATAADDYGTTDLQEMVDIDWRNIRDDPAIAHADLTNGYTVTVTPMEG